MLICVKLTEYITADEKIVIYKVKDFRLVANSPGTMDRFTATESGLGQLEVGRDSFGHLGMLSREERAEGEGCLSPLVLAFAVEGGEKFAFFSCKDFLSG